MGLDIIAAARIDLTRRLGESGVVHYDEQGRVLGGIIALNPTGESLPQEEGLPSGIFSVRGRAYGFKAGSYSGYEAWLAKLALMTGHTVAEVVGIVASGGTTPFGELINFSDCEGVIGPRTSRRLAQDFADWEERAQEFASRFEEDSKWSGDEWLHAYHDWRTAFEIASDDGAVSFG